MVSLGFSLMPFLISCISGCLIIKVLPKSSRVETKEILTLAAGIIVYIGVCYYCNFISSIGFVKFGFVKLRAFACFVGYLLIANNKIRCSEKSN